MDAVEKESGVQKIFKDSSHYLLLFPRFWNTVPSHQNVTRAVGIAAHPGAHLHKALLEQGPHQSQAGVQGLREGLEERVPALLSQGGWNKTPSQS